jgi:REP element-mobilizing transposase RayT
MPDHAHLIVWPRQKIYEISDIRKAIKAPVGAKGIAWLEEHAPEWLPRITRKRGSKTERLFWQSGGGHDRNVYKGRTLLDMIDYIHANPVRKGLVLRPRDWKWSSAAWFDDGTAIPLMVDHPSRGARGNLTSQAMEPRGWGRTAVTTRRARAGRSPQSAPSGTARWPHSAGGDLPGTSCL